jgi:signal transduction histidine kinase/phage shock protein PspC (stress-responsive transcriptional regulator)
MEERSGSTPSGLANGQAGQWRPWPGPGGAAPEDGDGRPAGGGPWRRWRHRRWVGQPRSSGPLRRRREDRLVAGVAAGLAARTGIDVTVVRIAFVVAALLGGFGVAAYVVAWLLLPAEGADGSIASKALNDRRGLALAAGLASLLAIMLLIANALGARWLNSIGLALVVSAVGITLIWRNSPEEEHAIIRRLAEPVLGLTQGGRRSRSLLRIAGSVLLLIIGLGALLSGRSAHQLAGPLAGLLVVIIAIVIMLGPWWLRIARDLVLERQARARAEERSDMAAHLHDSVLQTLALIQRRADQPQQVIQLARAQERELRSWLFDGPPPGSGDGHTLAAGVRLIQQEVEAQHEISVEAVTVGDCELDDNLEALLAAAREATVNAAKWSGASTVALFAEVDPAEVVLFVRDRGRGFDPEAVPSDRKGLAESIHARMERRGGSATVRSAPGEGTEVSLTMPRAAGRRQPSRPART